MAYVFSRSLMAVHISEVDFIVRHLPSWLPGIGFKRKAAEWKKVFDELREGPWETLKDNMAAGKAPPSFCSELLTQVGKTVSEQDQTDIKDTANSMYSASMDTVRCVLFGSGIE